MFRITGKYLAFATLAIGTFLGAFGAAPALAAGNADEAVSISVAYGDLNLDSAAGVETLYRRLRGAARDACDDSGGKRIAEIIAYRTCYAKALQQAVDSFNSVRLSALHEQADERAS